MNLGKSLHKLGDQAFRHPWRVIALWIIALAGLGFAASQLIQPTSSSISIPGTQAQAAIDRAGALFPNSGGGTGRIVFKAQADTTIESQKEAIQALVQEVGNVKGVSLAVSPFISPSFISQSGTIAYAQVQLDQQTGSVSEETLSAVESLVEKTRSDSLQIEVGGDLVSSTPGEILGVGEIAGVAVALLVLVMTLGSLIAAGMPILSALLAVGVSMAGLFALSQVVEINSTTPVLAVMLGLAVGIDYSLFIISKYRSLVLEGSDYQQAAARALGTAGNAVVFAAITVVIALSALSIVNIPFMTAMGLVGAASIAISAVVAITLVPALLGLAKHRIFSKKTRQTLASRPLKNNSAPIHHSTMWYRWGAAITRRPILVLISAVVLIGIIALPAKDLTLGLPTDQYASTETTERRAYDLLTEGFGVGFNGPLIVLVEKLPAVTEADRSTLRNSLLAQYATAGTQPIDAVQQQALLVQLEKAVTDNAKYIQLGKVATNLSASDNVQVATPAAVTDDGTAGIIQIIPKSAPSDAKTSELIQYLRSDAATQQVAPGTSATLAVTGATALQDDINKKLTEALPLYLGVVVGLSLLLLILAFRSILVPIKATLGFLLSVAAMFGAIVAVFQWGWFGLSDAPGPIVSFIPIIAIGILFGLAMDYEFFLVSGMHEAYQKTKNAKQAVLDGFGAGAKVVTAAAVIMISVFAGFITNHEAVIQSIGLGLAVGILVDAFLVRMTIVPAIMTLLGKSAWWLPAWLEKRLPHISIEGEADKSTK